jgi:hypothetical protein
MPRFRATGRHFSVTGDEGSKRTSRPLAAASSTMLSTSAANFEMWIEQRKALDSDSEVSGYGLD